MHYTDKAFGWFFAVLAILAALTFSRDWWYDLAFYAAIYLIFWALCRRHPQSNETITLLVLAPIPHLLGALGLYHLALGTLSWDAIVHTGTAFLGILLVFSFLRGRKLARWETVSMLVIVLLFGGALVEAVEWVGGRVAAPGEGLFFRGAGDYCTKRAPCTEAEDIAKDSVNNMIGMVLGLAAVLYRVQAKAAPR